MRPNRTAQLCLLLAAMALSGCVSPVARYENTQVYQPLKYPAGDWQPAGLQVEDTVFSADDGTRLHGWYCPHENPVAVALFCHGNMGNVSTQAETLRTLHDRHRLSIMTFDYRGYGRSEGTPDEPGILRDARAARRWLAHREGIDEHDIVLIGQSLGGGVAVDLAAGDGARGLVLTCTFTSLPDVAAYHAPLLPVHWLMRNRLESISKIGGYHGPLLMIHGDHDEVVPYEQGRRLFAAANEPKRFVTKVGAGHNDAMSDEERHALDEFLASLKQRADEDCGWLGSERTAAPSPGDLRAEARAVRN